MTDPRMNESAIPNDQPVSGKIPHDNDYQSVQSGGHNKVRTQPASDNIPENEPKVLAPGSKIPAGAMKVDPTKDAAQRTADSAGSTFVGGSAESTLQGATSGDFNSSIGAPVGGVSSQEAHHAGGASQDAQKVKEPT